MNDKIIEATRLWTLAVPTVSAFIHSLLRNVQDRDDVLQETAVAVLQSFDRYDATHSFVGWAIGIARNQLRIHYRKTGRDRLTFDHETIEQLAKTFEETDQPNSHLDQLRDCYAELDAKAKNLCRWRYEQDLKPAAISMHVNMSANTVAKALQRIRELLRACLERRMGVSSR